MVTDRARDVYSGYDTDNLKEDWKQRTKLTEKRSRQIQFLLYQYSGTDYPYCSFRLGSSRISGKDNRETS